MKRSELARKTPLRAKALMSRKPINRKATRKASTDKRWRSEPYLKWVRTQPCVVCGAQGNVAAHHIKGVFNLSGAGLTAPDSFAMPACDPFFGSFNDCHQQIHAIKALRDQQPAFLRTTLRAGITQFSGAAREQLTHALAFLEAKEQ